MNLGDRVSRALRPNAQAFDEVRITTVPRYKTSGLSGDEWRISGRIQLLRKGRVIAEKGMRDVETCAQALPYFILESMDNGLGFFAGEDDFCDQEGCAETATVTYQVKKHYCKEGHETEITLGKEIRRFCAKHSKRGDCGLDDADSNYILLDGKPELPDESAMSPSARVNIRVNSIEEIPRCGTENPQGDERKLMRQVLEGDLLSAMRGVVRDWQDSGIIYREGMKFFERIWIEEALTNNGNNQCAVAARERMHRNTVARIIERDQVAIGKRHNRNRGPDGLPLSQ